MNIKYGIFNKKGYSKHPTIDFDPEYIALEDLLNIDHSSISLEDVLKKIELVESQKSRLQQIGSERSLAEITPEKVTIYDMFEDMVSEEDVYPLVELSLDQFKEIILNWQQKRAELFAEIKNSEHEDKNEPFIS